MDMYRWKVRNINRKWCTVAYGPMSFTVEIFHSEKGIYITKPSSFFLDGPDFKEMCSTVKAAYRKEFGL